MAVVTLFRTRNTFLLSLLFLSSLLIQTVYSQQQDIAKCSAAVPCYRGCCSASGDCGFTDQHCKNGCLGNCDAKAECGRYSSSNNSTRIDCPIRTCCSKHGFCGTTDEFCGDGCEKNSKGEGCGPAKRPSCSANTDVSKYQRRIGYYELFNVKERKCNKVYPEDLEVGGLTHINLAFVNFGKDFKIIDEDGELVSRAAFLKTRYHGLKINIAVGGWTFNDPPTDTYFSDMARTVPNRQIFINSLIDYLRKYGLDGIDIDWEYPTATDRGGSPDDTKNFNSLVADIRKAFDREDPSWEISLTLPNSFWYLQHFDIESLEKHITYFNIMSYDLHGMWDEGNKWTGPYLKGHTNLTEIDMGLDLLWRNGIKPENVVLGLAFYGRSFTAKSTACTTPDGCEFRTSGVPGSCTATGGVLTYAEIASRNSSLDVQTYYDAETTTKYNVFGGGSQWVSYDDEQSFFDKKKYLSSRCLSGFMIWAIDQDTQTYDAMHALMGDFVGMDGSRLDKKTAEILADTFGAYTGQNCFVTEVCTDGSSKEKGKDQVCPSGFSSMSTAHNPVQAPGRKIKGDCSKGWYRHICCPTKNQPKNCRWNGAPERNVIGCSGRCGEGQFKLNSDTFLKADGQGICGYGQRHLCCDGTEVLNDCFWTSCQGPALPYDDAKCFKDDYEVVTHRWEQDNGNWCSDTYVDVVTGKMTGSPLHDRFKRAWCCPKNKKPQNCNWSNNPPPSQFPGGQVPYSKEITCLPQACGKGQTKMTEAAEPPPAPRENPTRTGLSCDGIQPGPNQSPLFPFCCDPPSKYNKQWPVDPKHLFEKFHNKDDSDVMWKYDNTFRNNNKDKKQSHPESENGEDAYGFVMLNGPAGSLDNDFPVTQTIVRRQAVIKPHMKRSLFTTNQTVIDSVFEHVEETIYVYCNFPQDSPECQKIWHKGAEDTIIRLPSHIGEGPFARVVSMTLADPEYQLPQHHLRSRSLEKNSNPVYKVTFDYAFDQIKRRDEEPVNMRIDFTNLLGYWDKVTDEPVDGKRRRRRDDMHEHIPRDEWRKNIKASKKRHDKIRKNIKKRMMSTSTDMSPNPSSSTESGLQRRWWGTFLGWLERMTKVENSNVGFLDMALEKSILIFKATYGCPGQTFSANMKMTLNADVRMDATYAYYFSGTIVPFQVTDTYAYFGLEPSAKIELRLVGNARLQASTGRKKLIDTLSYPGLAIKGIAAVGPTLDLYGEIRGVVTLKGEAVAGAKLNFGKSEVYWPQDDDAHKKYQELVGLETKTPERPDGLSIEPSFDVKVAVNAAIDVVVTPEANMGLKVGGGKAFGGKYLVNGQLVGYVNTSLSFQASADGGTNSDPKYKYGVYLFYNLGFNAVASVLGFGNWALGARNVFNPSPRFTVFERSGTFHPKSNSRRRSVPTIDSGPVFQLPRRGLAEGIKMSKIERDQFSLENQTSSVDLGHLFYKRDDSDTEMPDQSFSSQLQCPPGDDGEIKLPEFKYNCLVFRNQELKRTTVTPNVVINVKGICAGIQAHFDASGVDHRTLTWDSKSKKGDRNDVRRAFQCGNSYCEDDQKRYNLQMGTNNIRLSCDEFPPASTAEGGDYMSLIGKSGHVECVPAWQQSLQGNCNKLLSESKFATNIGRLAKDQGHPAGVEDFWVQWNGGDTTWLNAAPMAGTDSTVASADRPVQRETLYPTEMATTTPGRTSTTSWNFKRNFTMSLAYPNAEDDADAWNSGQTMQWTHRGDVTDNTVEFDEFDVRQIACAVNNFGQDDVYRADYNGLCFRGSFNTGTGAGGFQQAGKYKQCWVEFETRTNTRKRSIGDFHGWKVKSIKFLDDSDNEPGVEVPVGEIFGRGAPKPVADPLNESEKV